jgi:FkbM family methyltransferase
MIKYSVVIPTYNHCDDLLKPCVESILQYTHMKEVELIIVANGCVDNTQEYVAQLQQQFAQIGMVHHVKVISHDAPLGYSKACNEGIRAASTDFIVLLNNDCVLLPQARHTWLHMLHAPFEADDSMGISCVVKSWSDPAAHDFAIFFCVMIHRKVFDAIGVLNEAYGVGGGEDTEFSIECERAGFRVRECVNRTWDSHGHTFTGAFPIYHKGEGTVHDHALVPDWSQVFDHNSRLLAEKYNPAWLTETPPVCNTIPDPDPVSIATKLTWLAGVTPESAEIFSEVITNNCYRVTHAHVKNHTVIDVGANQGMFSIWAAELGATQVIACEPVHHTQELLRTNVTQSAWSHVIQCVPCAVSGSQTGVITMQVNTDSGKNSLYQAGEGEELVPLTTLAHVITAAREHDIFLKLDCEGAEYDILLDTPDPVFDRIRHVAIEIHGDTHPTHKGLHVIQDRLMRLGFTPQVQQPYGVWWLDAQGEVTHWQPLNMSIELWSKS